MQVAQVLTSIVGESTLPSTKFVMLNAPITTDFDNFRQALLEGVSGLVLLEEGISKADQHLLLENYLSFYQKHAADFVKIAEELTPGHLEQATQSTIQALANFFKINSQLRSHQTARYYGEFLEAQTLGLFSPSPYERACRLGPDIAEAVLVSTYHRALQAGLTKEAAQTILYKLTGQGWRLSSLCSYLLLNLDRLEFVFQVDTLTQQFTEQHSNLTSDKPVFIYDYDSQTVKLNGTIIVSGRGFRTRNLFAALYQGDELHKNTLKNKIWSREIALPSDWSNQLDEVVSDFRQKINRVVDGLGNNFIPAAIGSTYRFNLEVAEVQINTSQH